MAFGLMLFLTNVVLGVVMMKQSTNIIQELVRKNMLSLSNTAADILDGDALGALTEEDVGFEVYNEIYDDLTSFQNNIDIEYIYAVRKIDDNHFIFTVDPDPEDPAEFGEEVLVTEALISAGNGVAMVDNSPAQDEWGNFYSSYSPVFDSKGNIAGIVGIDFNSDWYDLQIREHTISIAILTAASIAVGGLIIFILISNIRRRFDFISNELSVLSNDVDALTKEITSRNDYKESIENNTSDKEESIDEAGDEIELLGEKLHSMHNELDNYLSFVREKANTDALTLVGNTTSYTERLKGIEEKITDKSADFSITIFDINDLKGINDYYGHQYGDLIIKAAADSLSSVFGIEDVYRIGGDEFIVIKENMDLKQMKEKVKEVNSKIKLYDETEMEHKGTLSLSAGSTAYNPKKDRNFREIFKRADDLMYSNKKKHYDHFHKMKETYH
ncbi:MAG: diguanylate cyclase [Erysipelotrichaceae bacterium]|nr:diguanylate cyclase [Erysipelotrichaceae bacterium]